MTKNILGIPDDVEITYASQDVIDQYEATALQFIKAVFGRDSIDMWLSDKSSLNDFYGMTLTDGLSDPDEQHWHTRVVALINKLYPRIELGDERILLIDLFARIEKAKFVQ